MDVINEIDLYEGTNFKYSHKYCHFTRLNDLYKVGSKQNQNSIDAIFSDAVLNNEKNWYCIHSTHKLNYPDNFYDFYNKINNIDAISIHNYYCEYLITDDKLLEKIKTIDGIFTLNLYETNSNFYNLNKTKAIVYKIDNNILVLKINEFLEYNKNHISYISLIRELKLKKLFQDGE
jgi:hypothetical protein